MGLTVRYFWFDREHQPHALSRSRFERLWNGKEPIPATSGRAVRLAEVVIEFANRQPQRVRRVDGLLAYCDDRGFVDQDWQREGMRLALESISDQLPIESGDQGKVRSMTGRRAIQRFRAEYRFEPTRREIEAIHRLIWTGSRSAGG